MASVKSPLMLIVPSFVKLDALVVLGPFDKPIGLPFDPEKFNVPLLMRLEEASAKTFSTDTMPVLPLPIEEDNCIVTPAPIVKVAVAPETGITLTGLLSPVMEIDPVPLMVASPFAA